MTDDMTSPRFDRLVFEGFAEHFNVRNDQISVEVLPTTNTVGTSMIFHRSEGLMRFASIFRISIPHDGATRFQVAPPNGPSPSQREMTIIKEALGQLEQRG